MLCIWFSISQYSDVVLRMLGFLPMNDVRVSVFMNERQECENGKGK